MPSIKLRLPRWVVQWSIPSSVGLRTFLVNGTVVLSGLGLPRPESNKITVGISSHSMQDGLGREGYSGLTLDVEDFKRERLDTFEGQSVA
jgi:hypothetical protein